VRRVVSLPPCACRQRLPIQEISVNTLARSDRFVVGSTPAFAYLREAWSGLNARHAYAILLATAIMTVVDISLLIDKSSKPGIWAVFGFDVLVSFLLFSLTVLAWTAVAHRPADDASVQRGRLLIAIVASAALTAAIAVPLMHATGLDQVVWAMMEKHKAAPPIWLAIAGNAVQLSVFSFLFVATGEILRRRETTQAALHGAQREHAAIAREVLESRLAAMQAQVEPQFLFDTLVDIEALYRADAPRAADNLDRLSPIYGWRCRGCARPARQSRPKYCWCRRTLKSCEPCEAAARP
jgi:hypothetical protein